MVRWTIFSELTQKYRFDSGGSNLYEILSKISKQQYQILISYSGIAFTRHDFPTTTMCIVSAGSEIFIEI